MTESTKTDFISTSARVLINEWQALSEIIRKNVAPIKAGSGTPAADPAALLSDRALSDVLHGPFQQFFKAKMTACATIAQARFMIVVTQDDLFKQTSKQYPKEALQKITVADLDQMQKILDTQIRTHYDQWQRQIEGWQKTLLLEFQTHDLPLSDLEIKEFVTQEPLSQLRDRFTDLHLDVTIPTLVDFEQYWRLKVHLVAHSSLSRRHEPHESHEIHKIIKKLNKTFNKIHEDETHLLTDQSKETQQVIEPLKKIKALVPKKS